ncbi:MAG: acyl-CoA dehydrogenase family protein [Actinobacteria bacterium]|nr:acyl-CoA dehydrogenase family protein [Actinomycetota bacterium]MCZ6519613.1 acyl-CoA dehydrogenase family protein [Actinomycetota bacterium]MCZ6567242.1 acyl-CoA dehydrogenase family protein [Actinomycetota bacterium]MCZ6629791.1 acyl-CoA dehydrogenase family protein [Actinomycetota bacterium]MCZ6737830.1 acyl-CoA dehydrogenase family protein [Actinomycetota bacterium]
MDFAYTQKVEDLRGRLLEFMESHVYPAESVYSKQMADSANPHHHPPVVEDLKGEARSRGLWNLFLPDVELGGGLTVLEYAPLAEITGRSPHIAPEALNCSAPDTGNMEILHMFGTPQQKETWLYPLLEGEIRSCFSMTEPDVASSDATNIRTRIEPDGDEYVISGRKWFSSGAASDRCKFSIVMGVTNPDADRHQMQSMVIVPLDAHGVEIEKEPTVFGYQDRGGHPQIRFDEVRVPASNLLGEEGGGFAIAQARLGPGRIHHCMRAIGASERCLDLMIQRSKARTAFGRPLSDQGVVREWIANARIDIEQARLLVLKTAWMIDNLGVKAARTEIAAIKVVAPKLLTWVADRAMQLFGAAGFTEDFPLAAFYSMGRWLQIADGPDEVHRRSVARAELGRLEAGADFVPPA